MKRFLLISLFMFAFILSGTLFVSSSASAASQYDNLIQPIDQLLITDPITNETVDISDTWGGMIVPGQYFSEQAYINWQNRNNWQVTQINPGQVHLTWSVMGEPETSIEFMSTMSPETYVVQLQPPVVYGAIITYYNGVWYLEEGEAYTNNVIAQQLCNPTCQIPTVYKIFLSTFPVNYPDDYEGELVPGTHETPIPFRPIYNYSIDTNGIVKINYGKNNETPLNGKGRYKIYQSNSDWEVGTEVNISDEQPFDKSSYIYDRLTTQGYYLFEIEYIPDGRENAPEGFATVEKMTFQVFWNGKDFLTENSIGCLGTTCNAQDEKNPILRVFDSLSVSFQGFDQVVLAPIIFIQTLPTLATTCTPITFPLMGTTVTLPCMKPMYDQYPQIMFVYYVVITGSVVLAVSFSIFRLIKNANNPKEDGIEAVKL